MFVVLFKWINKLGEPQREKEIKRIRLNEARVEHRAIGNIVAYVNITEFTHLDTYAYL